MVYGNMLGTAIAEYKTLASKGNPKNAPGKEWNLQVHVPPFMKTSASTPVPRPTPTEPLTLTLTLTLTFLFQRLPGHFLTWGSGGTV